MNKICKNDQHKNSVEKYMSITAEMLDWNAWLLLLYTIIVLHASKFDNYLWGTYPVMHYVSYFHFFICRYTWIAAEFIES